MPLPWKESPRHNMLVIPKPWKLSNLPNRKQPTLHQDKASEEGETSKGTTKEGTNQPTGEDLPAPVAAF